MAPDDAAYAGQKHYTARFLKIYDPLVLGFYGHVVWRCPTNRLVADYQRHIGRRHLDVGPGTGYFLERAGLDAAAQLVLLDPNLNVLVHAARRLARFRPSIVEADVLVPLAMLEDQRFDSVALNYVLHCLPGPIERKAAAIRNVADVLEPEGVLFGATVLGTPELHTWLSRAALRENNRRGIFDNLSDSREGLQAILAGSFERIEIELVGTVAVFTAARPRRTGRP